MLKLVSSALKKLRPTTPANEKTEEQIREEAQTVMIALVEIYSRHMSEEQLGAAQKEFNARVKELGWEPWFAQSASVLAPGSSARLLLPPDLT